MTTAPKAHVITHRPGRLALYLAIASLAALRCTATPCAPLPDLLARRSPTPALAETCLETWSDADTLRWRIVAHKGTRRWPGPAHAWAGELGGRFDLDLQALSDSVQANESPTLRWISLLAVAVPACAHLGLALTSGPWHFRGAAEVAP